jgi:uncharacterized phage protein (TIGR01671 family)
MSREIKFRAWDIFNKAWCKYHNLFKQENICFKHVNCLRNSDNPDCAVMQFTGLLDKNGKEIFEGDVIKIKCNGDIIIGDVFYNQSRCCYMINHPAGYNGSFGLHTLTIEICDEFNIVGNLYENPELLGGEND